MSVSSHFSPVSDGTNTNTIASSQPHSTLEVAHGRDYDKEAVPHHLLYPQPPQTSGAIWAGAAAAPAREEGRILGLQRRTFFILAWIASIVVAVAASVGGSLGATMGKHTCDVVTGENAAPFPGSGGITTSSTTTTPPSSRSPTPGVPADPDEFSSSSSSQPLTITTTTKPPAAPTATTKSSSTSPTNTASVQIGGVGGRCSNKWGSDCICLDEGICRNKWKGTPYTGTPDNWPCPNDPDNIMACVVKPCLGKTEPAQCLWREACNQTSPGEQSLPLPIQVL